MTIGDANSAGNPAALLTSGPYTIGLPVTVNATAGPTTLGTISSGGTSTFSGRDPERQQHRHAQQPGRRHGQLRRYRGTGPAR